MLNEILNYVIAEKSYCDESNILSFLEELNNTGMLLMFLANGGDFKNPFNSDKPIPVQLIPAPSFHGTKELCVNPREKQYYMHITVPHETPPMNWLTCWRNIHVCGGKFRRPHILCTHCLYIKRQRNMIGDYVPVQLVVLPMRSGRKYQALKNWLFKRVHEFTEWLID